MYRKIFLALVLLVGACIIYGIASSYFALKSVSDVPASQVMGNADGTLTVVEFLDYRCPYCRQIDPTIKEAVERDGSVRYIIRPLVFIDPYSVIATRAMYAADQQGKFKEMHDILVREERDLQEDVVKDIVASLGLNWAQFDTDMRSDGAAAYVQNNRNTFKAIGGTATPTFIIGHKIEYVPEGRMPNVLDFMKMFEQARQMGLK